MIARTRAATPSDETNCKRLFIAGFACLPWLWLVNYVYYRHTLLLSDTPTQMKTQIRYSFFGFCAAIFIWIIWLVIFYSSLDSTWARDILVF